MPQFYYGAELSKFCGICPAEFQAGLLPQEVRARRYVTPVFTAMPVTCTGCGQPFKSTGIKNHIRQSANPRCQGRQSPKSQQPKHPAPPPPIEDEDTENRDIPADPSGDLFGDYNMTVLQDERTSPASDDESDLETRHSTQSPSESSNSESEEEQDEGTLEAPRPQIQGDTTLCSPVVSPHTSDDTAQGTQTQAMHIRGEAEESLKNKPFIVRYPTASGAGKVHVANGRAWTNEAYEKGVKTGDVKGIYAPFSSEMEWDIVRWAKLRGPSSTALTELLQIKGVSTIFALQYFAH